MRGAPATISRARLSWPDVGRCRVGMSMARILRPRDSEGKRKQAGGARSSRYKCGMSEPSQAAARSWRDRLPAGVRPYTEKAPIAAFFVGVSSGFPYAMIGATLTTRLAQDGITKSTVTTFALAFLVYNLKFLWAWIVDGCGFRCWPVGRGFLAARRRVLVIAASLISRCRIRPLTSTIPRSRHLVGSRSTSTSDDAYRIEL